MQRIEVLKQLTAQVKESTALSAELTKSLSNLLTGLTVRVMREVMLGGGSSRDRIAQPNLLFITDKENDTAPLAQFLAKAYCIAGYLPTDRVTRLNAADLLDGDLGITAANTQNALESAMGGVILIDGIADLRSADTYAGALLNSFYGVLREHEFERDHLFILTVKAESDLYEHTWITCRFSEHITLAENENLKSLLS